MIYTLKYRAPGKRPDSTRWATRKVEGVREAIKWMNENKDRAFLPAFVQSYGATVAILGEVA